MAGTIFINYRKDDSRWNSLALYNELQKYFTKEQLFKDFNTILPGDDFVKSIEKALQQCDVLLVVIGPGWLHMKDEAGNRRLDDPDDFVRLEISTALSRDIKVVPVLIDNTPMPKELELPENMRLLYRRQFVEIDNTRFEDDVRNLAEAIKKVLPTQTNAHQQRQQKEQENVRLDQRQQSVDMKGPSFQKPSNNLLLAILAVIVCLPLGVVSLMSSNKVDNLWASGKYSEAISESSKAKNWAIFGYIAIVVIYVLYALAIAGTEGMN